MRQLQTAEVLQKTRSWLSLTPSSRQGKSQLWLSDNKIQLLCNSWHEDKEANRAGCKEFGEQAAAFSDLTPIFRGPPVNKFYLA